LARGKAARKKYEVAKRRQKERDAMARRQIVVDEAKAKVCMYMIYVLV